MNELQRYQDLLWLRTHGCAVDYPNPNVGQNLRIETTPSCLGTNIFPTADGTVIAFWLDIRASAAVILQGFFFEAYRLGEAWFSARSQKHDAYFCAPPGIWIHSSRVLNQALRCGHELQRNSHWKGFVLLTTSGTVPVSAGEKIEALCGLRDLRGHEYVLPLTLINRLVSADVLRKYGGEPSSHPR